MPASVLELDLRRELACDPRVAFTLISDPEALARWSTARIVLRAAGDGGHPGGLGALRDVHLPRGGVLREVIVASAPDRLGYRVIGGAPIREHRGALRLTPVPGGTRLRWTVRVVFPAPLMASVAGRLLRPELERSLDALVRIAGAARARPLPPRRDLPLEDVPALEARAEGVLTEQREMAARQRACGDPRHWFGQVYAYVTEAQLRACREGRFVHPDWVLRLVDRFHVHYRRAVDAADAGRAVEPHWERAFRAMGRDDVRARGVYAQAAYGVWRGMRAHIEDDLPRALAEVFAAHYAGRCDYVRFRGDYLQMGDIFREAGDRLMRHVPRAEHPLRQRLIEALLPPEVRDWQMARRFYDIPRHRAEAFARGEVAVPPSRG